MSEPIDHHYLPIFYLKQWAGDDGKVVRYHRPHREVVAHPLAPSNTGYEPGLYALDGYAPEHRNVIEKEFMGPAVDGPGAEALRVLLERDNSKMTSDLRVGWTRFLMSLRLRNPHMLGEIGKQALHVLRQNLLKNPEEYETWRGATGPATFLEWVEINTPPVLENFGKLLLPGLIDNEKIGEGFIKLRWWTVELRSDRFDLLTGDAPLFMSRGLGDESCLVALPLSPSFVFFGTRHRETLNHVMAHGAEAVIVALNQSVVQQARKHVYGRSDKHLRFVANRLRRT